MTKGCEETSKNEEISQKFVTSIAEESGVSIEETSKILKALGIDGLIANIGDAGVDVEKIAVSDLKLGARLGRSGLAV